MKRPAASGRRAFIAGLCGGLYGLSGLASSAAVDPLDQFVIVEDDGRRWLVIDGRTLTPRGRIDLPPRDYLPPRFAPDGATAYAISRDGWLTPVDLIGLRLRPELRVGASVHDLAVSGDGAWLLAAVDAPPALVLLHADLRPARRYPLRSAEGRPAVGAPVVIDAALRRRFVIAPAGLPELWEISYDPHAEDIYDGLVHDFRMGEGVPRRGFLGERRIVLPQPMRALMLDPVQAHAFGPAASGPGDVVNLDVRRRIAPLPIDGEWVPSTAAIVQPDGPRRLLVPMAGASRLRVVDLRQWVAEDDVALPAPACCVRAHRGAGSVGVLLDAAAGEPATLLSLDATGARIVRRAALAGGSAIGLDHDRAGSRVWTLTRAGPAGEDGLLRAHDADGDEPVWRLPVRRPVSIDAVANAVQRAQGRVP